MDTQPKARTVCARFKREFYTTITKNDIAQDDLWRLPPAGDLWPSACGFLIDVHMARQTKPVRYTICSTTCIIVCTIAERLSKTHHLLYEELRAAPHWHRDGFRRARCVGVVHYYCGICANWWRCEYHRSGWKSQRPSWCDFISGRIICLDLLSRTRFSY